MPTVDSSIRGLYVRRILICLLALSVFATPDNLRARDNAGPVRDLRNGVRAAGPVLGTPADTLLVTVAPAESLSVHMLGSGRDVVLVPGMLGADYGFRHIVPSLAQEGTRVTIVNMLGTGASSRPEDADYSLTAHAVRLGLALDSLRIRRATLVCHSVGASICYRLAIQRPELVHAIVSINGGPTEEAGTPGLRMALRFAPLIRLFGGEGTARGKVRSGLRDTSADPSWATEEVVAGYTAAFGRDLAAVLATMKRFAHAKEPEPLAPRLGEITAPVLLLVGGSPKRSIRDDEIELLMRVVPAIEMETVEGAGQYIHEEQPDAVVAASLRMVRAGRAHEW